MQTKKDFLLVLGVLKVILLYVELTLEHVLKIHGREFRIINDDTVEAVVDDPRGYERA
jgi:hypothetical protein